MSRWQGRIREAIAALGRGAGIVISDGVNSGGYFAIAVDALTPSGVHFMAVHTSGVVWVVAAEEGSEPPARPPSPQYSSMRYFDYSFSETDAGAAGEKSAPHGAGTTQSTLVGVSTLSPPGNPIRISTAGADPRRFLPPTTTIEALVHVLRRMSAQPTLAVSALIGRHGAASERGLPRQFARQHGLACVEASDLFRFDHAADSRVATPVRSAAAGERRRAGARRDQFRRALVGQRGWPLRHF